MLQAERVEGRVKRTQEMPLENLPDGAVIVRGETAYAVRGSHLMRWSESGYVEKIEGRRGTETVLTPPSIVAVLSAGYQPQWHPSAQEL